MAGREGLGIDFIGLDGGRFRGTFTVGGHCRYSDRGEPSFRAANKGLRFLGRPPMLAGAAIGVEGELAAAG